MYRPDLSIPAAAAYDTLQLVINAALQRGVFADTSGVINAQNALESLNASAIKGEVKKETDQL